LEKDVLQKGHKTDEDSIRMNKCNAIPHFIMIDLSLDKVSTFSVLFCRANERVKTHIQWLKHPMRLPRSSIDIILPSPAPSIAGRFSGEGP